MDYIKYCKELKLTLQFSPLSLIFPSLTPLIYRCRALFPIPQQKAKNEELIKLAEQRKKEVEREKKEAEEKERRAAVRREYERERQARVEEVSLLHTAIKRH